MRLRTILAACATLAALVSDGIARGDEFQSPPRSRGAVPDLQLAQADPPQTVRASRIGRLGFAYPPVRSSDEDMTILVQYVADGASKQCTATEVFTWVNVDPASEQAKEIFLAFDQALNLKGYDAIREDVKPPDDAEAAAAHVSILAYVAESRNRNADDALIVFVWYFEGNNIHLALCRAKPKEDSNEKD